MGFRINTNIAAMNAHTNAVINNRDLDSSIGKLSSGLRIQTAADDASGMSIADSLRSQANGLGQAIKNGNDAIGIVQTADKAMDEQIKILDTIRTKAIQSAQDGQNANSRHALQNDISRLLEELDNIAKTTSFNGQQLLNGSFSNKNFQIGAYSNETAKVSIGATDSNSIGHTRFETTNNVMFSSAENLTNAQTGIGDYNVIIEGFEFATVTSQEFIERGMQAFADQINAMSDKFGIRASVNNVQTLDFPITKGTIKDLTINGVNLGDISFEDGDKQNTLTRVINDRTHQHGVTASTTPDGRLTLATNDGRGIVLASSLYQPRARQAGYQSIEDLGIDQTPLDHGISMFGTMTLTRQGANDIVWEIKRTNGPQGAQAPSRTPDAAAIPVQPGNPIEISQSHRLFQETVNLKIANHGSFVASVARAMGLYPPNEPDIPNKPVASGVNTYAGAQAMIDIAESAQKTLDAIRADLGSVQNQLTATINNISVTQVNVKSAESQIRDVDFAEESANFSKFNILAQSGSYAMSQANSVQQNVMRLLQ